MDVKISHIEKEEWIIYPLDTEDYYLQKYKSFFECNMFIRQNMYSLKKIECSIERCNDCKKHIS